MPLENQPGTAENRKLEGGPVGRSPRAIPVTLYTPEERQRRDSSVWTLVQGVLAPVQFLVFLVSLALVFKRELKR